MAFAVANIDGDGVVRTRILFSVRHIKIHEENSHAFAEIIYNSNLSCPALGFNRPKCLYVRSVISRPRGVLCKNPS